VVLVLLGLFLAGFCVVGLPRGVGHIVAGSALVVMAVTVAAVPTTPAQPAAQVQPDVPTHGFVMQLQR
jgi:hypothetical protein